MKHNITNDYFGAYLQNAANLKIEILSRYKNLSLEDTAETEETQVELMHRVNRFLGRTIQRFTRIIERYKTGVKESGKEFGDKYHRAYLKAQKIVSEKRNELSSLNLGLLVSTAKHFKNRGISIEDLIEEGAIGLIHATEHYNPDHNPEEYPEGIEFGTYATDHIKKTIRLAIHNKLRENLKIPYHVCSNKGRIIQAESSLKHELTREPTPEEVATRFNESCYPEESNRHVNEKHIRHLWIVMNNKKSAPQNDDSVDEEFFKGFYSTKDPGISYDNKSIVELLLESLNDRERTVMRLRFGLDDGIPLTLQEVGNMIGLTRERIRQIEVESLKKLQKTKLAA